MFGGGGIGGEGQQRIALRILVAEHDLAILLGQHLAEAGEQRAIGRAGDRGGPELGGDEMAGIVVQVVRPCRMAVPRQDDRTRTGTPVYNVSLSLLQRCCPERPPYCILELPRMSPEAQRGAGGETEAR